MKRRCVNRSRRVAHTRRLAATVVSDVTPAALIEATDQLVTYLGVHPDRVHIIVVDDPAARDEIMAEFDLHDEFPGWFTTHPHGAVVVASCTDS